MVSVKKEKEKVGGREKRGRTIDVMCRVHASKHA